MNPCTAVTLLPPPEFVVRLAPPGGSRPEAGYLLGELAADHDGDHAMVLWEDDARHLAVWARWRATGRHWRNSPGAVRPIPKARTRAGCSRDTPPSTTGKSSMRRSWRWTPYSPGSTRTWPRATACDGPRHGPGKKSGEAAAFSSASRTRCSWTKSPALEPGATA